MRTNGIRHVNRFGALALAAAFSVCWGCDTQSGNGYRPPAVKATGEAPAEELEAIEEAEQEVQDEELDAVDESIDDPAGQPESDVDVQNDGALEIEDSAGNGDCGHRGADMTPADQ